MIQIASCERTFKIIQNWLNMLTAEAIRRGRGYSDRIFASLPLYRLPLFASINLFELTEGPLHSCMSDDERHKSVIDYIVLPASFIGKVNSCVVGKWQPDLMSDHVPITVSLNNQGLDKTVAWQPKQCGVRVDRKKVSWDNYCKTDIDTKYTVPLSVELSKVETEVHIDDLYGEILRSMWDVSERHLKVKHLSTRGDKNVIKFANKKKLPSHIVEVRKDLNKLSNARKLDDSEVLTKIFLPKERSTDC